VCDEALDALQERYARWRVLPAPAAAGVGSGLHEDSFRQPWIRSKSVEPHGALLVVEAGEAEREAFEALHGVVVDVQRLRLAEMFKLWTNGGAR
jgi:hypothetical protein